VNALQTFPTPHDEELRERAALRRRDDGGERRRRHRDLRDPVAIEVGRLVEQTVDRAVELVERAVDLRDPRPRRVTKVAAVDSAARRVGERGRALRLREPLCEPSDGGLCLLVLPPGLVEAHARTERVLVDAIRLDVAAEKRFERWTDEPGRRVAEHRIVVAVDDLLELLEPGRLLDRKRADSALERRTGERNDAAARTGLLEHILGELRLQPRALTGEHLRESEHVALRRIPESRLQILAEPEIGQRDLDGENPIARPRTILELRRDDGGLRPGNEIGEPSIERDDPDGTGLALGDVPPERALAGVPRRADECVVAERVLQSGARQDARHHSVPRAAREPGAASTGAEDTLVPEHAALDLVHGVAERNRVEHRAVVGDRDGLELFPGDEPA
jgi:hypothetical protein